MMGLSTTKLLAGAAALTLGLGLPAVANAHLRHHHHRYLVRVVPPAPVPAEYDNPLYVPERNDPDFGSTDADGVGVGRERPFLSTEDVTREFGVTPGPGFEIEGPPIGSSLPVIK